MLMKKKFITLLCIISLLVPWSDIGAQNVLFSEGFESTILPTGWHTEGTVTNASHNWNPSTNSAYEGSYSLRFNSYNAANGLTGILYTCPYTVSSSDLVVSFWVKNPTGGPLSIYISTDSGATYLSNPLSTDIENLPDWTQFTYSLSSYVGQKVTFVFHSVSNYGFDDAYHYLDNFVIREAATCAKPVNLLATSINQTSANLVWNLDVEGDTASVYILNVFDDAGNFVYQNQNITPTIGLNTLSYQLTGLQPGTNYHVTLKGDCSSAFRGKSNISDEYIFTTLCNPTTLPFTEDFENGTVAQTPTCWIIDAPTSETAISKTQKYEGNNSLKLVSTINTSALAATKQIAQAANDMEIDFMFYAPAGTNFVVGLMSDPRDMASLEQIYVATVEKGNQWVNYRFNTHRSAQGTTQNLSVVFVVTSGSARVCYLDNVDIHPIPSCVRLENVEVNSVDSNAVVIGWENPAITPSNNYLVEVMNCIDSTITFRNATVNPFNVTGLNIQTKYRFRVRNICAAGDSSQWSLPIYATTNCGANLNLPYVENFNAGSTIPFCWQSILPGMTIYTTTSSYSIYSRSGNSLKSPDSNNGHYMIASEPVHIPQSNVYEVNFWMFRTAGTYNCYDGEMVKIWVNNAPSLNGAVLLDSIHSCVQKYPEEDAFTDGMFNYFYKIPIQGTVYVIFETFHKNGVSMYFDDVTIQESLCKGMVHSLNTDINLANNTFNATWKTKSEETQWLVNFLLKTANNDTVYNADVLVSNKEYNLDLSTYVTENTQYSYSIKVRALCEGNDTIEPGISKTGSFKTPCLAKVLPIFESFESTVFPPECWTSYTDPNSRDASKVWGTNTSFVKSGSRSAMFPDANNKTVGYLNTPFFQVEAGKTYLLSYSQYRITSYSSTKKLEGIAMWLSQTPSDTTNAVKLGHISRYNNDSTITTAGMYDYQYEFTVPANGSYCIIIQAIQEYGSSNFIDDVMIEEKPNCINIASRDINIVPTATSVDITVSDTTVSAIEFVVCGSDVTVADSIKASDIHYVFHPTSTNKTATINGLTSDTGYNLFWRNICDETAGEYSIWSNIPTFFHTKCNYFTVTATDEFFDGFEDYELTTSFGSDQSCYVFETNKDFQVVGSLGDRLTNTGVQCVPYQGEKQIGTLWGSQGGLKREMYLQAGKTYEVSIYSRIDKYYSSDAAWMSLFYQAENSNDKVYCLSEQNFKEQWTLNSAFFSVPADGVYYVGFEQKQNGTTWYGVYDNFRVREVTCAPPTVHEILSITDHSVEIQMTSYATSWEVRVSTSAPDITLDNPAAYVIDTVNTTTFTINGLQDNTDYWYIIRSLCSDKNSDWTNPVKFTTNCVAQNIPYSNSFETANDLRCWRSFSNEESVMACSSTQHKFGYSSLKVSNITLVSPEMNVTSLSNYMISGWVYSTQDSASTIDIGVLIDPNDISTYEIIASVDVLNSNTWTEFVAYFNVLNTEDYEDFVNAKYVTIACSDNTYYFDNVSIEAIPNCPKPSAVVASIQDIGTAQVSWQGTATSYLVSTYISGTDAFVKDTVVNTNSAIIANLRPVTNYYFTIRGICSATDSSSISFSNIVYTPCDVISLPYNSNFGGSQPVCWDMLSSKANPTSSDLQWSYNSYYHYFYASLSKGDSLAKAYLVTPTFVMKDNNGIVLECRGNNTNLSVDFPVLYTLDNGTSWDTLQTALVNQGQLNTVQYVMPNVGPGTIAFQFVVERQETGYVYVYDFNVEEIEDCNRPQSVTTRVIGNSVNVQINDSVAEHTQWQYVYGIGNFDPNTKTPVLVNTDSFTLNDLEYQTEYSIYVRTYCSETETSTWYNPYTFKTGCGETTLPYFEGFEDLTSIQGAFDNQCYKFFTTGSNDLTSTNGYPRLNLPTPSMNYGANGTQAVRWVSSATYPIFLQLPPFPYNVNELGVAFNYRNESTSASNTPIIAGVMLPDDPASFITVHTCPLQTNPNTRVELDYSQLLPAGDYTGYVVAFKYGPGSADYYFASVDDITVVSKVKCSEDPTSAMTNITMNTISLDFDYYADSLEVKYAIEGTPVENISGSTYITGNNFTFDNLSAGTYYDFYYRNVCSGNAGEWVGPDTYRTFCDTIVVDENTPWVENFDNTGALRYPDCFFTLQSSEIDGTTYPIVVDTMVSTSPASLAMRGANIISLPLFDKELSEYRLTFYAKGSGNLFIGTVNDMAYNSFTTLTSTTLGGGVEYFDIDLSYYTTIAGNKLAFKTTSTSNLYIDSVCVKIKPECFVPRYFTVNSALDSSVNVSFTLSTIATGFEYVVYSNTDTITGTVNGVPADYNIAGLIPNTNYSISVRSICVGGELSEWSDTLSFLTENVLYLAPFSIDFEDAALNSKLNISNSSSINKFIIGTDANAVYSGTYALYVSDDNSSYHYEIDDESASNFVTLKTKFPRGKYQISYDWKGKGESNYDYGRIFLAPLTTNFVASTSAITGLNAHTIPAGCISLDDNDRLNGVSDWQHKEVTIDITQDNGYQLVIYWRNDYSTGNQPPFALDNLIINKLACYDAIDSVNVDFINPNSVGFSVYPNASLHDTVGYKITSTIDGTVAASGVFNVSGSNQIIVNNLADNTSYLAEFWGYCDGGATVVTKEMFTTPCLPVVLDNNNPFFEGFESVDRYQYFYNVMDCWNYETISGTSDWYSLDTSSTATGIRPYEGKQGFKLYKNSQKYFSREFTLAPGSYEISLRAMQEYLPGSSIAVNAINTADTAVTNILSAEVKNYYQPYVGKLVVTDAGTYEIGFFANTTNAGGYLYIDNISIKQTDFYQPSDIRVTNIASDRAYVMWSTSEDKHNLKVYTTQGSIALDTVLTGGENSLILNGLNGATDYVVSVRAISNSSQMSDSIYAYFTTLCSVYNSYNNNFDDAELMNSRPYCWDFEAYTSTGYPYSSSYPQWTVTQNNKLNGHTAIAVYNSYMTKNTVHSLYSPEIAVTENLMLSFDYFNNCTNAVGKDDSLVVTIVTNNGVESAPILVARAVDVNSNWASFIYDLTSYVDSTIRVKFWTRAYYEKTDQYIAIDNFSVSCIEDGFDMYVTACPQTNYVGNGFNIPASQLVEGDTVTFTNRNFGLNGECDTINTIHVYVPSSVATTNYDTICAGQVYNKGLFSGLTTAGRYTLSGTSSLGCDSNVILYLTVVDVNRYMTVNLCEGQTYNFAGQVISAAGVYSDTAINSRGCDSITILTVTYTAKYYEETAYFCEGTPYTWTKNGQTYSAAGRYENAMTNAYGCDSIEVLNLIMLPTNTYLTAELCQGQSYEFFGNTITEAGNYTHRLANSLGCDSIINLTVTTTAAPITKVSDYVCEGQDYYGYGFTLTGIVSDTMVTNTVKTLEGCDSIIELTLDFIPTAHVAITETINEGETYEFGGNSLSQAGEYTHTYHTALGCDSIVTLTLIVTTPVDNAYALPIIVAPNPVVGGQSTFVNREWTAEEQNGMRVEVLNAVGQVVDIFTPATFPIEVGGIYTSGVYYIRVTSGTGEVYLGRLVVK